jgi:hypothetical protein
MGTSIGAAIDYVVSALQPAVLAIDSNALVVDNYPTYTSKTMVFIGRTSPNDANAVSGAQQIVTVGANRQEEQYVIPCYISVYRPGPAQKPARDAALAMFDAVAHLIATDRTLGGVLLMGRYAQIENFVLEQTIDAEDAGESGTLRTAWISFNINAKNHYQA